MKSFFEKAQQHIKALEARKAQLEADIAHKLDIIKSLRASHQASVARERPSISSNGKDETRGVKRRQDDLEEQAQDGDFDEQGETLARDLFSGEPLVRGPKQAFERVKQEHGFDIIGFVKAQLLPSDSLAMARTVNYIRSQVSLGVAPDEVIKQVTTNAGNWQTKDEYLKPFLGSNDSLLWYGDDFSESEDGDLVSAEGENDKDDDEDGEEDIIEDDDEEEADLDDVVEANEE